MSITGIGINFNWGFDGSQFLQRRNAAQSQGGFALPDVGTDTVDLSTAGKDSALAQRDERFVKTGNPGEYMDTAAGGKFIRINDALTPDDKNLVIAATGGLDLVAPNGTHQINTLAMRIALDRAVGNLNGPVTASYLENAKNQERQTLALNRQQAGNLFAAGDATAGKALASQGPAISFDVIDKALAFLAQHMSHAPVAGDL